MDVERREALRKALRGELAGWRGLPEDCTPADLEALSSGGGEPGAGRLSGMPVTFRDYEGHPGLLRVWFDDDDRAFLVWADHPALTRPSEQILSEMGEPDARLDDAPSRIPGAVQWVWASRGVTAYVDLFGDGIRGLALFRPGSVEYYRTWLGADEPLPYRQRPG
jgi:hypothetical protein